MSTERTEQWDVIFYDILAEYAEQYIEARGNPAARAEILEDCAEEITISPLHSEKKEKIDLPEDLSEVIFSFH
jgi:hypothetical protein